MAFRYRRCLFAAILGVIVFVLDDGADGSEVSVRPTKLWRFLRKNEEALLQKFSENIDQFSVGRIKCLRYCIESKAAEDEAPHVVHLIWKLDQQQKLDLEPTPSVDKNFKSRIIQGKAIRSDPLEMENKCTFSIVIGCEILQGLEDNFDETEKNFMKNLQPNLDIVEGSEDNGSPTLNFVNKKLVDESNLMNETEIRFDVEPDQTEISAVILGDVDKIDLKMPIGTTPRTPRLTLASRMPGPRSDGGGSRLNVANPPPGGWRLRVAGAAGERYRLIVGSRSREGRSPRADLLDFPLENVEAQDVRKESGISSRQIEVAEENMDDTMTNDSNMNDQFLAKMISEGQSDQQDEQKPFKFPPPTYDVEVMDTNNTGISVRMDTPEIEDRMLDRDSLELDDLSRSLNDELPIKKNLIVEINPNTNLIANPGANHRITFDITNNHILTVRHYFAARSSQLRIIGVNPPYRFVEIAPGQTRSLTVDIFIPPTVTESIVNKVTLLVQGIESVEKTADLYVRTSANRVFDGERPTMYYYFNNNCAGRTSAEKCLKSYWSVDITVQDYESGLKSVTSSPKGAYPRYQYVSGTSSPVYFYYSSNCCNRVVEVIATDLAGNVYSRRIDVGVWYNLTDGEIAAVVIGVLFLILLIVFIVLLILYCRNNRESRDLSYSQRYGSRSAPRTE